MLQLKRAILKDEKEHGQRFPVLRRAYNHELQRQRQLLRGGEETPSDKSSTQNNNEESDEDYE